MGLDPTYSAERTEAVAGACPEHAYVTVAVGAVAVARKGAVVTAAVDTGELNWSF